MDRKALYVGAYLDLEIINKLFFIKDFVFIDSQPYSEFGKETALYDYNYYYWQNNFLSDLFPCFFRKINGYYRPNFLSDLKRTAKNLSIALTKEECNKLIFYNHFHNQNIIYLINTSIPEDLSKISNIIQDYTDLIVKGFHPNAKILNYTFSKIIFWGHKGTVYKYKEEDLEDNDKNNIIYGLTNNKLNHFFSNFYFIDDTIYKYPDWKTFLEYN